MEIWTQINEAADVAEIEKRYKELVAKSDEELNDLPPESTEAIVGDSRGSRVSVYKVMNKAEGMDVILQMYIPGRNFLLVKIASVAAVGFRVLPNGEKSELPKDILYEYM
ncbi:MAG: hypothetical protein KDG50_15370 [Chromatiales bacterium]|nr:hypothetical protein [Chromatiales bacterium]